MSNGIILLSHRDFALESSQNGAGVMPGQSPSTQMYDLTHRHPGISLVFYFSRSCKACQALISQYSTLNVQGVKFMMANVSADNMRLQKMSEATNTPIRYVPYLVIYINGKYYLEYRGPKNIQSIAKAMFEIAAKYYQNKNFTEGKVCTDSQGKAGYCIEDHAYENDDRCMTVEEVFDGKVCDAKTGTCYTVAEVFGTQ